MTSTQQDLIDAQIKYINESKKNINVSRKIQKAMLFSSGVTAGAIVIQAALMVFR